MSSWTTLTLRGLYSKDYKYSEYDDTDPYQANCDLGVSLTNDERVAHVGYWKRHVYAELVGNGYDWNAAESVLADGEEMIYDAVVIGANDTSDVGEARYYPVHDEWNGGPDAWTDCYRETQSEDGCYAGSIAASVMTARHGIVAQEHLRFRANEDNWESGFDDHDMETGRNMF